MEVRVEATTGGATNMSVPVLLSDAGVGAPEAATASSKH